MERTTKAAQIIILALVGLIAIGVCVVAGVLLFRSLGGDATPTAVAEIADAPVVPSSTPESGTEVDDSWQRIQAAGRIVVGTSVDYPLFEFYVAASQIDGYDIALMDEIGQRLGLQIDYRDIAFDGLDPALQVGQIDVAAAAISVTPDRQAAVDFSNVYFVGEDAILSREDSSASIGTAADLAGYKRSAAVLWRCDGLFATPDPGRRDEAGPELYQGLAGQEHRYLIMKEVWEPKYPGDTGTIKVHVRWLRLKIEDDPAAPCCLRTVRGMGYRFDVPESSPDLTPADTAVQ